MNLSGVTKRKGGLNELYMLRIIKLLIVKFKANEGTLVGGVSEKNIGLGSWSKFVRSVRFKPWEAEVTESLKFKIIGWLMKKGHIGRVML